VLIFSQYAILAKNSFVPANLSKINICTSASAAIFQLQGKISKRVFREGGKGGREREIKC
jgi:hypothetical protein